MNSSGKSERFLRACRREEVDATPVWFMRQAGRSLPAYRELRKLHGTIKDMAKQPELLTEITLLPMKELDVDAAIMFADIMLPLAGLGVEFDLVENVGPVIPEPIRSRKQVDAMTSIPAAESVPAVMEAIRLIRKELDGEVPLIGFSGAPFTLASYMIEGRPTRDFAKTKALMFGDPSTWHALMDRLANLVVDYLSEQIDAGIQAVQLFDSWIGALSPQDFDEYALPYSKRIFESMTGRDAPRIHFGTDTATLLERMASVECEVVGVDWRIPLDEAWDRVGHGKAIQGNLDPGVLLANAEVVEAKTKDVLRRAGGRNGHIFNLGHGVLPDSIVDNLKRVIEIVHTYQSS